VAIAVSLEVNSGDNADLTTYTMGTSGSTGSYTPPADPTLFILSLQASTAGAAAPQVPAPSWMGLTWTLQQACTAYRTASGTKASGYAFWAYGVGSAGLGSCVWPEAEIGSRWQLFKVTGGEIAASGALGARQSDKALNIAVDPATTLSTTLGSPSNSDSRCLALWYSNSGTGWTMARSGWSVLGESAHTGPGAMIGSGFNSTAWDATAEITNSTGAQRAAGVIGIELVAPNPAAFQAMSGG
jgi:hypothetical protein